MGALAGLLKEAGYEVSGVEGGPVYPPMSELLQELKIQVLTGYHWENIEKVAPDLAIVGNVIRKDNPEAEALFAKALPYLSLPEALYGFFIRGRKSLVVSGTHGKTTTSALLAYALERLGQDPTFFLGGLLTDRKRNYGLGSGPFVVLEGDEYDSAFFDKRPKFVHYAPSAVILTSIEFDHADIYPSLQELKEAFRDLVALLPEEGHLVYWADSEAVKEVAREFKGHKLGYGFAGELKLLSRVPARERPGQHVHFSLAGQEFDFYIPLMGEHNALNALAVFALLMALGFSPARIKEAFKDFCGTKRRQEILALSPVVIIDDFAHHPTAVKVTLKAVRETWPERRLLAAFEPRTNTSRRKIFQEDYVKALAEADVIFLKPPPDLDKIPQAERLNLATLAEKLRKLGRKAYLCQEKEELKDRILKELGPGEILIFLSNGPFDYLPRDIAEYFGGHK